MPPHTTPQGQPRGQGRSRRVPLATLTPEARAALAWALVGVAIRQQNHARAHRYLREAQRTHPDPPADLRDLVKDWLYTQAGRRRGRPTRAEAPIPDGWTLALRARRDTEITQRVEDWTAALRADRRTAMRQAREIAKASGRALGRDVLDARTVGDLAVRLTAWELSRADDVLSPAIVRRRITRANKSTIS